MRPGPPEPSVTGAHRSRERFDVSFVIPLYDKAPFIARAIRSAVAQTCPALEIIVVDDGSRDDGPTIVARMAAENPSIRLVTQTNAGPSAARNRGIALASGDWIAFLDADDVVVPRHIERIAALARRWPKVNVLGAAFRETHEGEHDRCLAELAAAPEQIGELITPVLSRWLHAPLFFTSSVVVRRSSLLALGQVFPEGENLGEDLDVWFRLAETQCFACTSAVGALYTVGLATSLTGAHHVTDVLPAYARLAHRSRSPAFPHHERTAARRLVATHWLNVARARSLSGDHPSATRLLTAPEARARPIYWLRTALLIWANRGRANPLRLGGL